MTKLINLTNLGQKTWSLYQKKFATLVGLLLIPFVLFLISPLLYQSANFFSFPLALVLFTSGSLMALWTGTAAIVVLAEQGKLTIKKALTQSWPKVWSLFWVSIIISFVAGGGAFLFLVPGIILSVYFIFAKIIAVTEGDKGMRALVRSREYVRGYFWPVFGRYLAIVFVLVLSSLILNYGASLFSDWVVSVSSAEIGIAVLLVVQTLINFLLSSLVLTAMYVLYENVRQVKGDLDPLPVKIQSFWYLVIGLAGWIFLAVMITLALVVLVSAVGGYVLGAFVSDIFNNSALMSTTTNPF